MGLNSHPYETLLQSAHRHGFGGIEVPAHAFGSVPAAREAGKRLEGLGMQWGLMMAPYDMFRVNDAQFEAGLEQWSRWLERAKAAGCSRAYNHFWPGSDEREYEENFEWHRNRLSRIHQVMQAHGFRYGLEFMGAQTVCEGFRYPFIRTLGETIALADSVSPEIGFVFDTIHWYTSGARTEDMDLALDKIGRVVNLHLNDAYPGRTAGEQIDRERAMPGESGIIDSVSVVREFYKRNYQGPVIVEPMAPATDRFESMTPDAVAEETSSCLDRIMKMAGVIR